MWRAPLLVGYVSLFRPCSKRSVTNSYHANVSAPQCCHLSILGRSSNFRARSLAFFAFPPSTPIAFSLPVGSIGRFPHQNYASGQWLVIVPKIASNYRKWPDALPSVRTWAIHRTAPIDIRPGRANSVPLSQLIIIELYFEKMSKIWTLSLTDIGCKEIASLASIAASSNFFIFILHNARLVNNTSLFGAFCSAFE